MLGSFINKINYTGEIKVDFTSNLKGQRFISEAEVIIYRCICELINNTIRYAQAKNIALSILKTPELLVVHYRDDGKGFNPEFTEREEVQGRGLYNIQSRINSINGRFSVQSEPGKGMEAEIVVKIKAILK